MHNDVFEWSENPSKRSVRKRKTSNGTESRTICESESKRHRDPSLGHGRLSTRIVRDRTLLYYTRADEGTGVGGRRSDAVALRGSANNGNRKARAREK